MPGSLFNRQIRLEFIDRADPSDVVEIDDPQIPGKEPLKITFQSDKQLATEPARAFIEIWNLADNTAARINFRKPVLAFEYGRKVNLFAGYGDQTKKIFSGVVVSAITSREGAIKITRVESRNIFYELMQLPIKRTATKGSSKSKFVLDILSDIDATIEGKARTLLNQRLAGQAFNETLNFQGTAYSIIDKINRGLLGVVNVFFDDIGTSFNPVGIPNNEPVRIYDARAGEIIGTPEPNEIGVEFKVPLDNDLKLGSPVLLLSDTVRAFFSKSQFVVKSVTHVGSNRAKEPFESRVTAVFNRTNQETAAIAV